MIQALETERATPLETVERWCAAHGGRLAQIASEQTRNGELVRDALQEVWLGLLRCRPPDAVAADPQRLFAWLLVAVRRRAVAPVLAEGRPVAAGDAVPDREVHDVEAGAVHDRVDLVLAAVRGDH